MCVCVCVCVIGGTDVLRDIHKLGGAGNLSACVCIYIHILTFLLTYVPFCICSFIYLFIYLLYMYICLFIYICTCLLICLFISGIDVLRDAYKCKYI